MRTPYLALLLLALAIAIAGGVLAQSAPVPPATVAETPATRSPIPKLSKRYKGYWWTRSPETFRELRQSTEFEVLTQSDDGRFTGTFTRDLMYPNSPANLCYKADKLPMQGTFDGEKLVLTIDPKGNHATCESYQWTLLRGKEHFFEYASASGNWRLFYDPAE